MVRFVSSILLGLSALQLAYAADGTVSLFRDRDCKGTKMWEGNVGSDKNNDNGGDQHEALSFSYSGYFKLLIADGPTFNDKTCGYCSDYHEDHHEGGCININTGFGPNSVRLIAAGNSPADIPCRNFLDRCPFPVPPGNGIEAQT